MSCTNNYDVSDVKECTWLRCWNAVMECQLYAHITIEQGKGSAAIWTRMSCTTHCGVS